MSTTRTSTERDLKADSRWRRPFNVLQTNLQEIDAAMDVEAALDAVQDYGADTWLLNAGGIVSFYPTELPFQTRNPFLDRRASGDLLGDAVAAAKRRGIRIIARFDMSKLSPEIAAEHPEWLYRSPQGEPQVYNSLVSACPSGAYYQEKTFEVLDEVFDRYDVDSVFFNWFNFNERDYDEVMHGPCHCEPCASGFAEFSGGEPLPDDMRSPTFGLWRRYAAAVLGDLTARIADHVEARGKDIGVILRKGSPIEYVEGNNAYRAMPGKELWPHAVAEAVSAHVSSRPDSSVMVNCVAFIDATYRMGSEQPEHFAQYVLHGAARGGNPSAYFFGAPGRLPMEKAIAAGRDVMRFRARHGAIYDGLTPAATIALVRPDFGSAAPGKYWEVVEEFRGFYSALLESHLPFDVVPVDALAGEGAAEMLERFSTVILPDVGSLRGGASAIDAVAERGGTVVLSGSSAVGADGGIELECSPALVAGQILRDEDLRSTYVTDVPQPGAAEHHYSAPVVPVFGAYRSFEWKPDAEPVGNVLPKAPFGPPEVSYGHVLGSDPDRVRIQYGEGVVVHIPWSIGRTYREFGKTDVRDHLLSVLRPDLSPSVTAELPESVEIIVARQQDATVVHLINHSGLRRRTYGPHLPVVGGRLRLVGAAGGSPRSARSLQSGQELRSAAEGEDLVIELPTVELFDVVVIDS